MKKPAFLSADWVKQYFGPLLLLILSLSFLVRVYQLQVPSTYIFDEVYHAVTAKLMAKNDPRAFEWWNEAPEPNTSVDWLHPPYAKYTQAASMLVFGQNSFGWRFSSAVVGVGVIALTAAVAVKLFGDHRLALLAALLASFDGLLLVQSRIAMNDIHVSFMILLTIWCYLHFRQFKQLRWLVITGIAAGVAIGTKWSGIFILGWVGIWESLTWLHHWLSQKQFQLKKMLGHALSFGLSRAVFLLLVPLIMYVLAYWQMFFLHGKSFICWQNQPVQGQCYTLYHQNPDTLAYEDTGVLLSHFQELHRQIWGYQTGLEATHDYQSRPWQWFLNLRPVWFHVSYADDGSNQVTNIYALGNPALFWFGAAGVLSVTGWLLFLPTRVVMLAVAKRTPFTELAKTFRSNLKKQLAQFKLSPAEYGQLLLLISAYGIVWLPWILSPRIMFFYHYTPAVPLLSIVLAWLVLRVTGPTWLRVSIISIIGLCFVVWLPIWIGLPVPQSLFDHLYTVLPSWR